MKMWKMNIGLAGLLLFSGPMWAQEEEASPPQTEAPAPSAPSRPLTPVGPTNENEIEVMGPMSGDDNGPTVEIPSDESATTEAKSGAPESYNIQSGDTLWDVCQKLLDNPWYWPKLWSLNEYISNPHLIYPGRQLVFFPGSETAPPRMELVGGESEAPKTVAAPAVEAPIEREPEILGVGPKKIQVRLKPVIFLSERELKMAGKVTHSGEPKMNLVYGDTVYLSIKKKDAVAVGNEFQVIEVVKKVKDPDSSFHSLGYLVKRKAIIRVTCIFPKTIEGIIVDAEDSVSREDKIVPYSSPMRSVEVHERCSKPVMGKIAAADHEQYMISNQDYVFLNRGKKQGIENGQVLAVVRRGDGVSMMEDKGLPDVIFGRLLVVDAEENTSTAYVVDLRDSLSIGDRVTCPMPDCGLGSRSKVSCK